MNKLTNKAALLFKTLKKQLETVNEQSSSVLRRTDAAICHCRNALKALRQSMTDRPFANCAEEILFFKELKPTFMAELLYYILLYQLYERSPMGDARLPKGQLENALWQVQQFFKEHHDFYVYWRTSRTDRDKYYFIHTGRDTLAPLMGIYFDPDDPFCTGYDLLLAYMMAYERLEVYLTAKIEPGRKEETAVNQPAVPLLPWTGNKAALIELLYALDCTGVVGNGKIRLKEMAEAFEQFFGTELGNYSNALMAFRARKTSPTLFIDEMKAALLEKLEEDD